jgi:hypothetical protein
MKVVWLSSLAVFFSGCSVGVLIATLICEHA